MYLALYFQIWLYCRCSLFISVCDWEVTLSAKVLSILHAKISTLALAFTYVSLIKTMPLRPLFFLVPFLQLSHPIKSVAMLTWQGNTGCCCFTSSSQWCSRLWSPALLCASFALPTQSTSFSSIWGSYYQLLFPSIYARKNCRSKQPCLSHGGVLELWNQSSKLS